MRQTSSSSKILIVKTSSLGDVIQTLSVLDYLHQKNPETIVDWVVDTAFHSIVAAHPFVRQAISLSIRASKKNFSFKRLWNELKTLRKEKYDVIFDLQKNSKSGLITLLARGKNKVGFGFKTVREWPNILATTIRFDIPKNLHSNLQALSLLQQYFHDFTVFKPNQISFKLDQVDLILVGKLVDRGWCPRIMVCPGSTGINRQVPIATLALILKQVGATLGAFFYLVWGDAQGRQQCEHLQENLGTSSVLVDRLSAPVWQSLMSKMDLVLAVDSSALHLCATTSTPSFSFFGPTNAVNIKPQGKRHFALQGKCPYGKTFVRQCPLLRSCASGACIKNFPAEMVANELISFYRKIEMKEEGS